MTSASSDDGARATAGLLWTACHRHPQSAVVRRAIEDGADVGHAALLAVAHRTAALLWRSLELVGALDGLGEHRDRLRALLDVQRMQDTLLVPHALRLALSPLTDAGMEPVVLKGPAVARRYPDRGLRPFDDFDVLLPRRQHGPAVRVLEQAGWRVSRNPARSRYDTVLRHPESPSLPLELHYGLAAWYERANGLRAERLWARRVPLELAGTKAFGLPLPEELVALCIHAAKPYHTFCRMIWVADLAMVLGHAAERGEAVDWDRVEALAADGRCRTAVGAGLALARHAGASVPPGLLPLPGRGWRGAALDNLMDPSWILAGADQPRFHLRFALADTVLRRSLLLAGSTHGMNPLQAVGRMGWSIGRGARRWAALTRRR